MKFDRDKHHRKSIRLKGYDYTQPGAYYVTICTYQRQFPLGEIVDGGMVLNPCGEIAREEWFKTAEIRGNVRLEEDEFVIMPNHLHGIIWIIETDVGATGPEGSSASVGATASEGLSTSVGATASEGLSTSVGATGPVAPTKTHTPTHPVTQPISHTPSHPVTQPNSTDLTKPVTHPNSHTPTQDEDPHGPKPGSIGAIIGQFKSVTSKRINRLLNSPGAPVWQRNYYEHIIRNDEELAAIRRYIQNNPLNWEGDQDNLIHLRIGEEP